MWLTCRREWGRQVSGDQWVAPQPGIVHLLTFAAQEWPFLQVQRGSVGSLLLIGLVLFMTCSFGVWSRSGTVRAVSLASPRSVRRLGR